MNQEDASGTPVQPKPESSKAPCACSGPSTPCAFWGPDTFQSLSTLIPRKKGPAISAVQSPDDWIELEFTVDSGACETVMPANLCQAISILKSATAHGAEYGVANGATIPNLGERRCLMMTVGSRTAKIITLSSR